MSDPLPLDHLVYAVPDLEEAIAHFEKRLGVRAWFGGRHEGFGSHNAILPMRDTSYVELIALDPANPEPAQPPPFGLAELREAKLVTWAVRSTDLAADTAASKERGYDPGLLFPASRTQPDGERLEWKLTLRPDPIGDGLIPFVIDWEATPHPARPDDDVARCTLRGFSAEHPEPDAIARALHALGARLDVRENSEPKLCATLEGPAGHIELH
ncbi:MAG: VOC family protein [Myxococcota bacterium]|jgi:hypothetical protein|nr:VOC family protein [Myxococcota bacterium]